MDGKSFEPGVVLGADEPGVEGRRVLQGKPTIAVPGGEVGDIRLDVVRGLAGVGDEFDG